jgi:hypothetical protein
MEFDFASMRHVREAMQASINAALQYRGDYTDYMFNMFCTIMEQLESSPLETKGMQTFAANSGMVQIYLISLLANANAPIVFNEHVVDECQTLDAFILVTLICRDNATTSAQMVLADVVRTIDSASPITPKSAHWHKTRDELIAILAHETV